RPSVLLSARHGDAICRSLYEPGLGSVKRLFLAVVLRSAVVRDSTSHEPPRVAWRLWGALGSVEARNWPHATVLVPSAPRWASNSIGVSIPNDECRRWRLWNSSRYTKSAVANSSLVDQACRSRSSTCTRLQNDSIKAL